MSKATKLITSTANPRVKEWSQLLNKKGRDQQGKFIIEGVHLVKEAIASGAPIECIIYLMDQPLPEAISPDDCPGVEWIGVSQAVLAKCTDTQTPQGIMAVVHKWPEDLERILQDDRSLVVVIDGIQDPGNLGTIIRSADAVGATGVIIGDHSVDLYHPKTVRSTMGSMFHVPIVQINLLSLLSEVQRLPVQILGTSLQAEQLCYEVNFRKSTWIIVGNETKGVSPELARFVDQEIKIPMIGQAESLNVAMATTVLLYEALRQRQFSPNKNSCP